jgi:hypothetical protein
MSDASSVDKNYLTYKLDKVYFLLNQYIANHGKDLTPHQLSTLKKCFVSDELSYEEYKLGKNADRAYRERFAEDPE